MMKRWAYVVVSSMALGCQVEAQRGNSLPMAVGEGIAAPAVPAVSDLMRPDVAAGERSRAFSGTGTLYPKDQVELGPKVTGVLQSVEFDEGDLVKKGQVVFRLDSAQSRLMVQQAEAQLQVARSNLAAVKLEYDRAKELHARGALPTASYEQIQARFDAVSTGVTQAEVATSLARRAVADTAVTSPISGVVAARYKNPGETATMMPVTVVLVVQDVSVLELRVRLPETALRYLKPGASLKASFPAIDGERTVAVERINPAVDVVTRTAEVIAKLDNADGSLRPGMLANVELAEPGAAP